VASTRKVRNRYCQLMSTNQTVCRKLIGNELRHAREEKGVNQDQAADHIGAKVSKISRLELGQTRVSMAEVKMLLEFYGHDPEHTDGLLTLARGANQRGRWDGHRASIQDWFRMYVDLEAGAEEIRQIHAELVPGLLQAEPYTRATHAQAIATAYDPNVVENQIQVRLERQRLLRGDNSPTVSFVLSESCVRREVGSAEVMHTQLAHLLELAQLKHVQIQVMPYKTKNYVGGMSHGFTLLTMSASGLASPLNIVYVETYDDASYIDDKGVVRDYASQWRRMTAAALGPAESADFIREVAAHYE
jgi:transcriptional regulator with XRE-family HTH domain